MLGHQTCNILYEQEQDIIYLCSGRQKATHVREAMEEYLASKRREMKPRMLSETGRILGYFCDFCEGRGITLEDVRPRTIDEYLDHLCLLVTA
jgi:hypothetical protein